MEILWLAIVLYSIGVGLVLHFKPSQMFHEKGQWKEFGYQRGPRFTIFPFWLFAVLWAFCSYLLATTITWAIPALAITIPLFAVASEEEEDASWNSLEGEVQEVDENETPNIGSKRSRGRPRKTPATVENPVEPTSTKLEKPKPGYYVLQEPNATGIRKYVYYGDQPPEDTEAYHEAESE